jgi:hypothetical protein
MLFASIRLLAHWHLIARTQVGLWEPGEGDSHAGFYESRGATPRPLT